MLTEKRAAHAALLRRLSEEDLRAAERTGIHISREHRLIELTVFMTSVVPNSWKIRSDLGGLPLDGFPTLAESSITGFLLV
jgi:hypothetical protein